jgi:two-component sensor histidine kinase
LLIHTSRLKCRGNKDISDVHVDISSAIPLALIVNELITNAYKHAFTKNKNGSIEVSLSEKDKQVILVIKDNGKGFDKNIVPKKLYRHGYFKWTC